MKKKLTERSFENLKNRFVALSKMQQKAIVGGGYFEDYGIGYFDPQGEYHWMRTKEDSSQTGATYNNYWDSMNSFMPNGDGMYENNSRDGYGTKNKPISIDDYNKLAMADRWFGGFVESLGFVGVYASSVDYGNSIFSGSWYRYGSENNPVSEPDFYQFVHDNKWHGGYVKNLGYQPENPSLPGSSDTNSLSPINKNGVSISVSRSFYGDSSTMSYFVATAYDSGGNVIATLSGMFLEPGAYYDRSKVEGSDTAIMPGTYKVVESTFKGEPGYYEVSGVEGRTAIKIHSGRTGKHTSGCFLPGVSGSLNPSTGEYQVSDSDAKSKELTNFLNRYGAGGITMSVTI